VDKTHYKTLNNHKL